MATDPPDPSAQGLPASHSGVKNYAAMLVSSGIFPPQDPTVSNAPVLGLHKGLPSISFDDSTIQELSKPYGWSLIGKFAQGFNKSNPKLGRPSTEDIQKYLLSLDFKGSFSVGLLDNRHVWIRFSTQEDYLRLYSRPMWKIGPVTMRMFKWTPYFRTDIESSLVPIWVSFPRIPIQFFHKNALFPIASLLGLPLRVDAATNSLKRPSVARIQIELDLLKPRPDKIWITVGKAGGYWQNVEYEAVPHYCSHCMHVGHSEQTCMVQNPGLAPREEKQTAQWIPKKQEPSTDLATSLPVANTQSNDPLATSKDKEATVNASPLVTPVDLVDSDEDSEPLLAQEIGFPAQQIAVEEIPTQNRIVFSADISESQTNVDSLETPQKVGNNLVEPEAIQNLATTPGLVAEAANEVLATTLDKKQVNSWAMEDKVDLENPSIVTTGDPLETPTGIYFRQKIPLLRRSASTIGLIQSYKENTPCERSCLILDNESESEEDYDTEVFEEIIVMDKMGRLRLQLQPVTPNATNQGNTQSLAKPSELKSVISPVPSAPSPTASPSEDGVLALASLSAPAIVDSTTDYSSTTTLQDEPPFEQPKNRGRRKKTQVNTSQSKSTTVSTASAFVILSEE